jgi:hypothetical protein
MATKTKTKSKKGDVPEVLKDLGIAFTKKHYRELIARDPESHWELLASNSWQDPENFSENALTIDETIEIFSLGDDDAKQKDTNWRELQKKCWEKYRTFGPLRSAIDSKADYICGSGFKVYSETLPLQQYLRDLQFSPRNKLYQKYISWIVRMLTEAELFLLFAINPDTGAITIRTIEPSRVGEGSDDDGLVVDPDDVSQTIFYMYFAAGGKEAIPDVRWILEPEYMEERKKALEDFDDKDIQKITKEPKFKKATGGYRRFIMHWKNLTGEHNVRRDGSALNTTLEWINLYIKAIKWELDYKRALAAYTIEIRFNDSPAGKVAWYKWSKMTQEQKDATKLTTPLTPGSRVFVMPGMEIEIHSPQLSTLSGSNQDLLNMAGAGAKTPQDLWQGQSSGATYASLRSSRPPLLADIDNLQQKFKLWHRYEFMRVCLTASLKTKPNFVLPLAGKTKYKLEETYPKRIVTAWNAGTAKIEEIDVEPCEKILYKFPSVKLIDNPDDKMNAMLGSKHAGAYSLGTSRKTAARHIGVDGLEYEKNEQAIEEEKYGEVKSGFETEQNLEKGNGSQPKKPKKKPPEE